METLTKESTSMNVEKANKQESGNKELIERYPVKESPFTVITIEDKHFGVMGEYKMTEDYKSRGECEDELRRITWNRIIQVMMVLDQIRKKDKEFDKELNNKLTTKTK